MGCEARTNPSTTIGRPNSGLRVKGNPLVRGGMWQVRDSNSRSLRG
jgi:hypothetical protein